MTCRFAPSHDLFGGEDIIREEILSKMKRATRVQLIAFPNPWDAKGPK